MLALVAALALIASDPFVVDGDTLWVTIDGARERVRVANIDAPELQKPQCPAERSRAEAATRETWRMVLAARTVTVTHDRARDSRGRLLVRVQLDGADLGEALIARDLAVRWAGRQHAWCVTP